MLMGLTFARKNNAFISLDNKKAPVLTRYMCILMLFGHVMFESDMIHVCYVQFARNFRIFYPSQIDDSGSVYPI